MKAENFRPLRGHLLDHFKVCFFNMGLTPHRTLFWKMLKKNCKIASLLFDIYHGVLKSGWSKFVQGVSVDWARQRCSSQLNKVKIFSQFLSSRFATSYSKYLSRTYVAKLHDQSLDKCWMYPVEPFLHLKTFASFVIFISPFLWSNILK